MATKQETLPIYIDVSAGATIPIPNQKFGFLRPDVAFKNIDISQPLEPQIEAAKAAALIVAAAVEETLAQQLADMSGLTVEGTGMVAELANAKADITALKRVANTLTSAVKAITGKNPLKGSEDVETSVDK